MDHDHSEVGGTDGKGLLPALGGGDLENGGNNEDVGDEEGCRACNDQDADN